MFASKVIRSVFPILLVLLHAANSHAIPLELSTAGISPDPKLAAQVQINSTGELTASSAAGSIGIVNIIWESLPKAKGSSRRVSGINIQIDRFQYSDRAPANLEIQLYKKSDPENPAFKASVLLERDYTNETLNIPFLTEENATSTFNINELHSIVLRIAAQSNSINISCVEAVRGFNGECGSITPRKSAAAKKLKSMKEDERYLKVIVTDRESKVPLDGATVRFVSFGKMVKATTDADGVALEVFKKGTTVAAEVSLKGYITNSSDSFKLNENKTAKIRLKSKGEPKPTFTPRQNESPNPDPTSPVADPTPKPGDPTPPIPPTPFPTSPSQPTPTLRPGEPTPDFTPDPAKPTPTRTSTRTPSRTPTITNTPTATYTYTPSSTPTPVPIAPYFLSNQVVMNTESSVTPGTTITLSVGTVYGTGPFRYQWYERSLLGLPSNSPDRAISGATGPSFTFTAGASNNSMTYRCVVTNDVGSATSMYTPVLNVNSIIPPAWSSPVIGAPKWVPYSTLGNNSASGMTCVIPVTLKWSDRSLGESGFRVYKSAIGAISEYRGYWGVMGTTAANATSLTVYQVLGGPGQQYFKVEAFKAGAVGISQWYVLNVNSSFSCN